MIWLIALFSLFARPAAADVIIPTTTTVYFEDQSQPINQSVDFIVSCYGYSYPPGEDPNYPPGGYKTGEVYSFSDTCTSYGCTIDEPYYLNYRHIDYCLVSGTVGDRKLLA